MSACPSVVITIASERKELQTLQIISHRPVGIENGLYRSVGSGTSHINQTGIPESWAHGKSDYQI